MAISGHDQNGRPTIITVLNTDGKTINVVKADPTTHRLAINDATTGSNNGNNGGNAAIDENGVNTWIAQSSNGSGDIVQVYSNSGGQVFINSN